MKNKFPSFIEDKIRAELEKRDLLYKNLKKEDLSNRDTIEHIRNKFLVFLRKNLTNSKCKKSWEFLKNSIVKIEKEINNEKIILEVKNNLVVKIEEPEVKKKISNPFQPVVRGKPIPYAGNITREFVENNRHLGGPCDPNEIIEKKEKKSNSFFCAKFNGYY
jgi:hypothetical protein